MLENVEILGHSSLKFKFDKIIYIDPYKINSNINDADVIFITHSHYDHLSSEDIEKIRKEDTIIIVPEDAKLQVLKMGFKERNITIVEPNRHYYTNGIEFYTLPAYNENKKFHPKENEWVGYNILLDGIVYYIAGDTDAIDDLRYVKCDVAFLPVDGTYTMNYVEAATLANEIKPRIVVPVHYGVIAGTIQDAYNFKRLVDKNITVYIEEDNNN